MREINKMGKTLKQEAEEYVPPTTLNIADLEKVSVNIELKDGEGKDSDGETFKYKYAEIDGKEYRVAGSVIGQLKAILEKMPATEFVTVTKQGIGLNTRYQTMPFTEGVTKEELVAPTPQ